MLNNSLTETPLNYKAEEPRKYLVNAPEDKRWVHFMIWSPKGRAGNRCRYAEPMTNRPHPRKSISFRVAARCRPSEPATVGLVLFTL